MQRCLRMGAREGARAPPRLGRRRAPARATQAHGRTLSGASDALPPSFVLRARWAAATEGLVAASTAPFLALALPQVAKNAANLAAGDAAALAGLPWLGYAASLVGNMLMLSYFSRNHERMAACVQLVGVMGQSAVLAQVAGAGHMPGWAVAVIAAGVVTGLGVNFTAVLGIKPGRLMTLLQGVWYAAGVLVGATTLPAFVLQAVAPGASIWQGVCLGAVACAVALHARRVTAEDLQATKQERGALGSAWVPVGAWVATLHFMFLGLSQILQNMRNPETLAGLSIASVLLGATGNALMMPRALHNRDRVWLLGSSWGTLVTGWGCLLSVQLLGGPGLSAAGMAALTGLLACYLAAIVAADRLARSSAP